jgi:hypothetical protein
MKFFPNNGRLIYSTKPINFNDVKIQVYKYSKYTSFNFFCRGALLFDVAPMFLNIIPTIFYVIRL